jgi:hypothetical protein
VSDTGASYHGEASTGTSRREARRARVEWGILGKPFPSLGGLDCLTDWYGLEHSTVPQWVGEVGFQ